MTRVLALCRCFVPRIAILAVVLLVLQFAIAAALRWAVCQSACSAGAHFDDVCVSPWNCNIIVKGLRLGDPILPAPMLLEADVCQLDAQFPPLLHKQIVIDHGRLAGLRIRGETILSEPRTDDTAPSRPRCLLDQGADQPARDWLAQLVARFQQSSVADFESLRRAESFCLRWTSDRAALRELAAELDSITSSLQRDTAHAESNRLRYSDFFLGLPKQIAALQNDFEVFGEKLDSCSAALETERRAIVALRRDDEQRFREKLQVEPVDSAALTAYLLRDHVEAPLRALIRALGWARHNIPAQRQPASSQARGEDILFAGCPPAPNLLIRTLQLEGAARLGRQSLEFHGQLTDLNNDPAHHAKPIRLRLTGTATTPLVLQATLDRTADTARDELLFDCQAVELPAAEWGRTDELSLKISPSRGSISISMAAEGETIRGDIQLVQKKLHMSPATHGPLAELQLETPLASTLGKFNSVVTRLSISGTVEEPTCTLWSNLGPAAAESLRQAAEQAADQHARTLLAGARRRIDEQLANIQRQLGRERATLLTHIAKMSRQLDALAARQTPPERLTTERLGRTLPATSLFK